MIMMVEWYYSKLWHGTTMRWKFWRRFSRAYRNLYGYNRIKIEKGDYKEEDLINLWDSDPLNIDIYVNMDDKYMYRFDPDLENNFSEYHGIEILSKIDYLHLSNQKLKKIPDLTLLTNLRILDIAGVRYIPYEERAQFSNFEAIPQIDRLEELYIQNNNFTSLKGIEKYKNLRFLNIGGNQITSLDGIEALNKLEVLLCYQNNIQDLTPILNLPKLKFIIALENQIHQFHFIQKPLKLVELDLGGDYLENIDEISKITTLRYLYLYRNRIKDISKVIKLKNLILLNVFRNEITELPELSFRKKLKFFDYEQNPILYPNQ